MTEQIIQDLVGLNNPSLLGNEIDKQWNERRASSRPKTALHERRQQQLSEMKSQYLQPTIKPQPEIKHEFHPLPQKKELGYQFIEALEKFLEQQTRDSGVAQCLQLIEKNKDQQSLQTMIECLWSSSRKGLNPKTNSQNSLAVDMELMTLGEILKQNDSGLNQYMIEKIFQIIKKNLNTTNETTLQALAYVVIQTINHVSLSSIYQQFYECLHDKSRQTQVVHVLSLFCYYLKQQNKLDDLNMLAQLLFEVFSKLLIDSLEFLKCIEFLVALNISYNHEILIQRLLRYCRVPINKTSTYYLIVAQVCTILELLGTKTRAMSAEVIGEMKKLTNDRRVIIQAGAKKVIASWEEKEIKTVEPSLDQFFNKILYCQVPYVEYQKKGFQSFLRASTFVRKNSRSPSLPKLKQNKPQKIREKIQKMRSGSPKFQLLDEDQEYKRIEALEKLKQKQQEKQQVEEMFEDSLEADPFQKPVKVTPQEQPIIYEEPPKNEQGSLLQQQNFGEMSSPENSLKLNKMPSLQFIDKVQTIKQSLHEIQLEQQPNLEQAVKINNNHQVTHKTIEKQTNENVDEIRSPTQHQVQDPSPQQSQKYIKIEPLVQKVRAAIDLNENQEMSLQFEEDSNQPDLLPGVFPIREIKNFQASFQEFPKEFKTANNNINYELEQIEDQNIPKSEEQENDAQLKVYEKVQKENRVKSALEPEQEVKEIDLSDGQEIESQLDLQIQQDNIKINDEKIQHVNQQAQKPIEQIIQLEKSNESSKSKEKKQKPESEIIKEYTPTQPKQLNMQTVKKEEEASQLNQVIIQSKSNLSSQKGNSKKQIVSFNIPEENHLTQQQYFELAINKINDNINDAYQILFENCDDLQKIHFMMVAGPQINRLNNKMLNKIIEFMQKIKEAELLNVLGLGLYSQVKECNYFDEINHQELQNVKEVLYDICGSEKESIGFPAANIYNEL